MNRKTIVRWLGYALTVVSLYLLWQVFEHSSGRVVRVQWGAQAVALFAAGVMVTLIGHFNLAWCWYLQVRDKYPGISVQQSWTVLGRSQIAKYLPGNVGHVIGRSWLLREAVQKKDIAYTFLLESLLIAVSATLLGLIFFVYFDFPVEVDRWYLGLVGGGVLLAAVSLNLVLRRWPALIYVRYAVLIKIVLLNLAVFLLFGLLLTGLNGLYEGVPQLSVIQYAAGFALAFLVGYVLPGAPGGIGVREYAFVLLFKPFINQGVALEMVVMVRLMSMLGDLLFFAMAQLQARSMADGAGH